MSPGEKITIRTGFNEKSIISLKNGVESNVINNFDITSDFINLTDGENTVQYSADSGAENLGIIIDYTPLYLGV